MRKLSLLTLSLAALLPTLSKAQFIKPENLSIGMFFTGAVDYSQHPQEEGKHKGKPVHAFYGISPALVFETKITEHRLTYNIVNARIQTLHNYKLKHFGIYADFEKSLNSKEKYVGLGLEKAVKFHSPKWVVISFYCEFGTNFTNPIFSGGFILQPKVAILNWEKRHTR